MMCNRLWKNEHGVEEKGRRSDEQEYIQLVPGTTVNLYYVGIYNIFYQRRTCN